MTDAEVRKYLGKLDYERIGDVFQECEKRGCTIGFFQAFDYRLHTVPFWQTEGFIKSRHSDEWKKYKCRQLRVFLEVLVEKRPNHEKVDEWKKSLKLLEEHGY